jgi:hypothetical protein
LYALLMSHTSSAVVELNHAVAVAMVDGPAAALLLVDAIHARGSVPTWSDDQFMGYSIVGLHWLLTAFTPVPYLLALLPSSRAVHPKTTGRAARRHQNRCRDADSRTVICRL